MPQAARILDVTGITTQRIRLAAPSYTFEAGQYTEVIHPGGTRIPLSIASAPTRLPELELHYRSTPGLPEAAAMDELLLAETLLLSDAAGDVRRPANDVALRIITGGSGAAQAFCLAEDRAKHTTAQTRVIWCVDEERDVYELDRLKSLADTVRIFVDDRRTRANEGLLWIAVHATEFAGEAIVISGSPQFVYAVTDVLVENGLDRAQLQADAYAYAPRDP